MSSVQIINEIAKLSLVEKLRVVEVVLHNIREEEEKSALQLSEAARILLNDYLNDEELTLFTAIDHEDFYETK